MSDIPKCTSWRGHLFEARYSYSGAKEGFKAGAFKGDAMSYETMIRAWQPKTYDRDICVRCGFVIEAKTENHPA